MTVARGRGTFLSAVLGRERSLEGWACRSGRSPLYPCAGLAPRFTLIAATKGRGGGGMADNSNKDEALAHFQAITGNSDLDECRSDC